MGERNLLIKLLGDATNLKKAFQEGGSGAEGMAGKFDGLKGKLAGALSAGAVIAFGTDCVKSFESVAAATGKLQRLTGGTAEDMSRLSFEAKESGVSQEMLEKSIVKMSKAMVGNNKAFTDLGVATKDAQGNLRPMGDVMADLADKFKEMPNGAAKNALALQLFGKTGTDMLPMLNRGGEALAEFGKEADKFGLTIGQGSVDAYKKHVAESRKMHAAMEGLKVQIGEKLFPIFAKFASFMAEYLPKAIDFCKGVIESLQPTFQAIGEWIATLVVWWKAHWDEISTTVENVFGYISGAVSTFVAVVQTIWENFGSNILQYLQGTWDAISGVFQGAFEVIEGLFDFFKDLFTGKWGKLWGDVLQVLTGVWDAIKAVIKGTLEIIGAVLDAAWTVIKDAAGAVWDGIKAAISGAWDGIKSLVSAGVDAVITFMANLPGRALDALSNLGNMLLNVGKDALSALWDGVSGGLEAGWHWITELPGKFADGFAKIPGAIWSAFKAAWNGIADFATFKIPQVTIPMPPGVPDIHFGGGSVSLLPHLHTGGIIPGLSGQEVMVVARAGERVQTQGQASRDGGGDLVINNHNYGITDQREQARAQAREFGWQLIAA